MQELDRYSVTYPRAFVARQGGLGFNAVGSVFQVEGLTSTDVVAYRFENGIPVYLSGIQVSGAPGAYSASFPGSATTQDYVIAGADARLKPVINAVRATSDIKSGNAQYLIITHPDFISGLEPLINARQAQGLTVKVVNVEDIYDQYSYGIFDAQAIKNYLSYAIQNMGMQYVLLVGADTYDYRNYLGRNGLSFIPSLYARTDNLVTYAPVDPLYVDVDNNFVPDVRLGVSRCITQLNCNI